MQASAWRALANQGGLLALYTTNHGSLGVILEDREARLLVPVVERLFGGRACPNIASGTTELTLPRRYFVSYGRKGKLGSRRDVCPGRDGLWTNRMSADLLLDGRGTRRYQQFKGLITKLVCVCCWVRWPMASHYQTSWIIDRSGRKWTPVR